MVYREERAGRRGIEGSEVPSSGPRTGFELFGFDVLLDAALNAIGQAAAAGDEINLPGFGKFKVKSMSERSGRNPATGEAITIAPSKKLTFTPAKALKDRL